jgi:hypothetical protein
VHQKKFLFSFQEEPFDWPTINIFGTCGHSPTQKKPKYAAKIYDSFSKIEAYWEHLKEHNENLMGT